ncbi:hypothetical protein [Dactylosporangium roseum]|uniref:hypothetical protein n=1 Tax=Dactylosporangium roseum TaxID=47989 RepID=UPI0021B18644|nr:hypothetical protein [Dactylosporangium roseum]
MSESLLDKARRLQELAAEVKAAKNAVQHAKRLQNRARDLRAALDAPSSAAQTWIACRAAGAADLPMPDDAGLARAMADLGRRLKASEPPPDTDFDAVENGLLAWARRTNDAVARAWPAFARSKAATALASVRVLPPAARQSLSETISAVEQALTRPPTNAAQVRMFLRNAAAVEREVSAARLQDLPAPLLPVLERLGDGGIPLSELTDEQVRLLRERGLADDLVVRWTA